MSAPLQKERKPPAFHSYMDHAGKGGIAKGSFHALGKIAAPLYILFYFQQFFFYGAVIRYVRYIGKGVGQGFPAFQKCRQGKRHTDEVQPPDKREAEKKRICTSFSPFTS